MERFQCADQVAGYGTLSSIALGEGLRCPDAEGSQGEAALAVALLGPCKYLRHHHESFSLEVQNLADALCFVRL